MVYIWGKFIYIFIYIYMWCVYIFTIYIHHMYMVNIYIYYKYIYGESLEGYTIYNDKHILIPSLPHYCYVLIPLHPISNPYLVLLALLPKYVPNLTASHNQLQVQTPYHDLRKAWCVLAPTCLFRHTAFILPWDMPNLLPLRLFFLWLKHSYPRLSVTCPTPFEHAGFSSNVTFFWKALCEPLSQNITYVALSYIFNLKIFFWYMFPEEFPRPRKMPWHTKAFVKYLATDQSTSGNYYSYLSLRFF